MKKTLEDHLSYAANLSKVLGPPLFAPPRDHPAHTDEPSGLRPGIQTAYG